VQLRVKTQGRGEQVPKIPMNSLVIELYRIFLDGNVFPGGSGDEVSSHWLEIETAVLPGRFIDIPQVPGRMTTTTTAPAIAGPAPRSAGSSP
jgi:hypothetical protein